MNRENTPNTHKLTYDLLEKSDEPSMTEIPFGETWQGFEAEEHAEKTYEFIKCSTCIYGTECKKEKSGNFNPDSYCHDFKPDWEKIFL